VADAADQPPGRSQHAAPKPRTCGSRASGREQRVQRTRGSTRAWPRTRTGAWSTRSTAPASWRSATSTTSFRCVPRRAPGAAHARRRHLRGLPVAAQDRLAGPRRRSGTTSASVLPPAYMKGSLSSSRSSGTSGGRVAAGSWAFADGSGSAIPTPDRLHGHRQRGERERPDLFFERGLPGHRTVRLRPWTASPRAPVRELEGTGDGAPPAWKAGGARAAPPMFESIVGRGSGAGGGAVFRSRCGFTFDDGSWPRAMGRPNAGRVPLPEALEGAKPWKWPRRAGARRELEQQLVRASPSRPPRRRIWTAKWMMWLQTVSNSPAFSL